MSADVEKLIEAAYRHGENNGDFEMTVGDLEEILRNAWKRLPEKDQQEVMDEFQSLIEENPEEDT
jgi:hypothetical protein